MKRWNRELAGLAQSALRLVVAAGVTFLLLATGTNLSAQEARRGYTTEADLQNAGYREAIQKFWSTNASHGEFEGRKSVNIRFVAVKPSGDGAKSDAIVISSGRTESYVKYKELAYDLAHRNGYWVYIHDHRGQGFSGREAGIRDGCGESGKPIPGRATLEDCQRGHVQDFNDFVEDLAQFVKLVKSGAVKDRITKWGENWADADKTKIPAHPHFFLLAHSMGGAIASRYLESKPKEAAIFQAAVLSSPMHRIKGFQGWTATAASCPTATLASRKWPDQLVAFGTGYTEVAFNENEYTNSVDRYDWFRSEYRKTPEVQLGSPTHGWLAEACKASALAIEDAYKIRIPVRLYEAGEDSIVHPGGHGDFCKMLQKGEVEVNKKEGCGGENRGPIVVKGAKHELFIERDEYRTQVLEGALRFFARNRSRVATPGSTAAGASQ